MKTIDLIANWNTIKKYGDNKAVKNAYIWLIIVPIAAKSLNEIPDKITIPFVKHDILLLTTLPFSWFILYFSALAFFIGYLLYIFFCPKIIKDFSDYGEFELQGHGERELRFEFNSLVFKQNKQNISEYKNNKVGKLDYQRLVNDFVNESSSKEEFKIINGSNKETPDLCVDYLLDRFTISEEKVPRFFSTIRTDIAPSDRPILKNISFTFYVIGFIGLLWIMVQNIISVIEIAFA